MIAYYAYACMVFLIAGFSDSILCICMHGVPHSGFSAIACMVFLIAGFSAIAYYACMVFLIAGISDSILCMHGVPYCRVQ